MMYRSALHTCLLLALSVYLNPAQAQNQVAAEDWIDGMLATLPDFFCQTDQYFMQCFEVSQEECRSVTKQQAERCLDEVSSQIPALLNMPEDGRKWGSDVGRCAGIGYDLTLTDHKQSGPQCNPPG